MKSVSKVILALILMSNTAMAQVIELGTNEMEVVTSWEDGQALISWETKNQVTQVIL